MTRRRTVALAIAAVVAGTLTLPGSVFAAAAAGEPGPSSRVAVPGGPAGGRLILRVAAGVDPAPVASDVAAAGAQVIAVQDGLGTLVADVPADRLGAVRAVPGIHVISSDYELKAQSLGFDPATQPGSMTNITKITGATSLWQSGVTGAGVDVAVIDTGIAPVPGLMDSAKVVVGPDLSFESQDDDLRHLDTYGHGTHLAGIIAGRQTAEASGSDYVADTTNFYGMAPDARLVSLKLADHNGVVDVSQIIAAVDWVVQNRLTDGMNIRVLNLSYGTHSPQSPQADPLSWAAEVAWRNGIVVVTSAGNDGDTVPGLTNPAYNPWVIAVGAADTQGTMSLSDDTVASFSARQGGNFNTRGIDLVAPGVGVVSLGVPGSYVYQNNPSAQVGDGYLRGSGTSQAAAVVSGATALLLSQRPLLTPNQVKALLIKGATKLPGQEIAAQGNGELNVTASAALSPEGAAPVQPVGNGRGGLESARGGIHVVMEGQELADERDIMGNSFVSRVQGALAQRRTAWGPGGSFNGAIWLGTGFSTDTTSWAGKTWGGKTWTGKTWAGKTWTGDGWSGKTWSNVVWTGKSWSSAGWTSTVSSDAWAGALWTTEYWG
jgi:serine protease AprX